MKRCPYCGQEYSDNFSICATDQNALEVYDPELSRPQQTSLTVSRSVLAAYNAKTAHTKAALISGACLIASIAFFLFWGLLSGISGGFDVLLVLGAFMSVKVILFAAFIAFIVQGFRVRWGWGVANMFIGPVAGIVFFFKHRREGKVPVYILSHAVILLLIFVIWATTWPHVASRN